MQGLVILSEMRSGTTWLCSLTNQTEQLGHASEWLNMLRFPPPDKASADDHFRHVMDLATRGGRFAIKIFPWQAHALKARFGYDFVKRCMDEHDPCVVLVDRRDRLLQAISATRAQQTGRWTTVQRAEKAEIFDFEAICEQIRHLEDSMTFWRSYLAARGIAHDAFYYEDLCADWKPYIAHVSKRLDQPVDVASIDAGRFRVQRDGVTDDWVARFRQHRDSPDMLTYIRGRRVYPRTPRTFWRLVTKKHLPV